MNEAETQGYWKRVRGEEAAKRQGFWDKYVLLRDGETYNETWKKALPHITGISRAERALPRFKKFYRDYLQATSAASVRKLPHEVAPPSDNEIIAELDDFSVNGINTYYAGVLKEAYERWKIEDRAQVAKANGGKREKKK